MATEVDVQKKLKQLEEQLQDVVSFVQEKKKKKNRRKEKKNRRKMDLRNSWIKISIIEE